MVMTVGALSRRTGVPVKTLRTYEDMGLIYTVGRSAGNYRLFDEDALWCVGVVSGLRTLRCLPHRRLPGPSVPALAATQIRPSLVWRDLRFGGGHRGALAPLFSAGGTSCVAALPIAH